VTPGRVENSEGRTMTQHKKRAARERRERDTRKVVNGVQFHEAGSLRTFTDEPDDKDALEERLTPEQVEYLKAQGAIEGDWDPQGEEMEPMARSRMSRAGLAAQQQTGQGSHDELARLRRENAELKAARTEAERLREENQRLKKNRADEAEAEEKARAKAAKDAADEK
jgi:hypothetical protein